MRSIEHNISILQSWFSPAFPIGGFSYSHGLERAINQGLVKDAESLQDWIASIISHGTGRNDALFIQAAFKGEDCNDLCLGLAAGRERHQETVEMGRAFTNVVNESYGLALPDGLAYPVAVGVAASKLGLDPGLTIQSYLQAFASNLISVGVRNIPIGQMAGQSCLVRLMPGIHKLKDEVDVSSLDDLGGSALIADIVSMQHEYDDVRMYRT
ncbi:urease accessory protein UreF [Alphaproteobacteria bacterium LSUCC0684]